MVVHSIRCKLNEMIYCSHEQSFGTSYSKSLQRQIKQTGIKPGYLLISSLKEFNCLDATLYSMNSILTDHKRLVKLQKIIMFPIVFKSTSKQRGIRTIDEKHSHVILGLCIQNKFGALGLSREKSLTSKPFYCNTLSGLVINYTKSFQSLNHTIEKIQIGELVQTIHLDLPFNWKKYTVFINDNTSSYLDSIAKNITSRE